MAAWGVVADGSLVITHLQSLTTLEAFSTLLASLESGVVGLDLPFGQPRRFLEGVGWGHTWEQVVSTIRSLRKEAFLAQIKAFRDQQPAGHKHLLRHCDALAGAISPMMVHGVPIGRMWYVAAPLLLASGICVLPNHPTPHATTALEVYPALVAKAAGVATYKTDDRQKATATHRAQRLALLDFLQNHAQVTYGLRVTLANRVAQHCVADVTGDSIDAVCAALQAAWAAQQPTLGIPPTADPLEGWICDPLLHHR